MTAAIVKVIIGMFIWMVLPNLLYKKKKIKSTGPQYFVCITCKIIGIAIVVLSILNFLGTILSY